MFRYVVSLDDVEYSDWIQETSCLSNIVLFRKDADVLLTSRTAWMCYFVLCLVCVYNTEWTPWNLIQEVTVGASAFAALTMSSVLPTKVWSPGVFSRCAHFAVVGVCFKYRHTCWSSGIISSAAVAFVLGLFGCWIACAAVIVRALLVEQGRHGRESVSYIPHFNSPDTERVH